MLNLRPALTLQAILDVLATAGAMTVQDLATATGAPHQDVSLALERLRALRLVGENGLDPAATRTYPLLPTDRCVVGLDVGGTKIAAALHDLTGRELSTSTTLTPTLDATGFREQLPQLIAHLLREAGRTKDNLVSICVGIAGVVDPQSTALSHVPNIATGSGPELVAGLASQFPSATVQLHNDANLAAVGERWQGWGKQAHDLAFLSVGTGVGLGVILEDRLLLGRDGSAGEIGWLPLIGDPAYEPDPGGPPVGGAFEEVVGGRGFTLHVRRHVAAAADATVLSADTLPVNIFRAAAEGDRLAAELAAREARLLAAAIACIAAVVAPEIVVLGGGIGTNPVMARLVRQHAARIVAREVQIQTSALGVRAGVLGAVALALSAGREVRAAEPDEPAEIHSQQPE